MIEILKPHTQKLYDTLIFLYGQPIYTDASMKLWTYEDRGVSLVCGREYDTAVLTDTDGAARVEIAQLTIPLILDWFGGDA